MSVNPVRMAEDAAALTARIATLARAASIELNLLDLDEFAASRRFLAAGQRVYISHLPRQRWEDTVAACKRVREAGLSPIPHVPIRLLDSEATLDRLFGALVECADELLLISGDYPHPAGPYAAVLDVLRADKLRAHGFRRVSFAGHPEGHPSVTAEAILRVQIEKAQLAREQGIETAFVTQFFFEAAPFLDWATTLRAQGVREARLIAGLAGPARTATLLKFAKCCGVGRSMRALMGRPGAMSKLIVDHGPESVMIELARAAARAPLFDGLHFFCFGGYLRTCEWLHAVAAGNIDMREEGFGVR